MPTGLTDLDLARLHTRFSLPLVYADVLRRPEALAGDEVYAMHEIFSELQPDTALICAALCARHVASMYEQASARTLAIACERIVMDFGPLWLDHAESADRIGAEIVESRLLDVPDELLSLVALIDAMAAEIPASDLRAANLLKVLRVQCNAHRDIADEYLRALLAEDPAIDDLHPGVIGSANDNRTHAHARPALRLV